MSKSQIRSKYFQHKIKQDKTTEECHQSVAKEGSYSALSALPFKTI